ncbi:hypothetical protein Pan258_01360 [Symmachiella dynata]|uniref:tandem-95 repeat protein n=1 Tax=Symmachiella dynata TaxID=2527995 RepID=UPI00118BD5D5|nr:Ig-like domain-containing protein [Symmachiella dynata]QDT46119.1 hypothetical protein Pan258_01360 [Symmachiella dynata]
MLGNIGEHLIRKLERIIGLPTDARTPRLRQIMGLSRDRCELALFRRLDFECMEGRTLLSADLGFAFGVGDNQDDVGYELDTDSAGNVYVTGEFRGTVDFDPTAGVTDLVSNGGSDVFIAKYDSDGNFLWAKSFGGTGDDTGQSISVDASGKIYVIGNFDGTVGVDFDPGVDSDIKAGGSTSDAFVLKLDAAGEYEWSNTFIGAGFISGTDLEVDAAGNVYAAGSFTGTADFDPLAGVIIPIATNGSFDAYLAKMNSDGDMVWVETFGAGRIDGISGIDLDSSGNIVTTGYYMDTVDFDTGVGTSFGISGADSFDTFVSKFDSDGTFLWVTTTQAAGQNVARDVVVDADDNIVFVGSYTGTVDFDPGVGVASLTSEGGNDIFVTKLDSSGALLWTASMGGEDEDIAYGVDVDANNNVFVVGEYQNTADFNPLGLDIFNLISTASYSAFAVKLNSAGDFQWAATSEGAGDAYAYGIAVDMNGRLLSTGSVFGTTDLDPTASTETVISSGGSDIFLQVLFDNTPPTTSGISDVNTTEDGADAVVDLFAAFNDNESADADLTYTITGNTNAALFSGLLINGVAGTLTLQFDENAFGSSVITVRATDSDGLYVETTFTVNVAAENDDPTTSGIGDVSVAEDAADTVINLFTAFADVEDSDSTLVYSITGNTNAGLFSGINIDGGAGTLTLSYAANAFGTGLITVRATDTEGQFIETTFTVTVAPENDTPTTVGIANITVLEDSLLNHIDLFDAFTDVEDADSALNYTVTNNTNPLLFSDISIDPVTGKLSVNLASNQFGTSDITIRAIDTGGEWVDTTFRITVISQNDIPVSDNDSYQLWQNSRLDTNDSVLDNDSDVESSDLQAVLVRGAAHGRVILASDGTFSYIPDAGFYGVDQFTYAASDGSALSETSTVTLSVARMPTAEGDDFAVIANTPLLVSDGGVLNNDSPADGDIGQVELVSGPAHGTVRLYANGEFLYTPDADYVGQDSFSYRVVGSDSTSAAAAVTIDVQPPPLVLNDAETGIENPFDSTNELINSSQAAAAISDAVAAQTSSQAPHLNSVTDTDESNYFVFHGSDNDLGLYSLTGGGVTDPQLVGQFTDAHSDAPLGDVDAAGGNGALVADSNNAMQLRTGSWAVPVDDDLLLNSAYFEGDESAFVFDRIIEQSSTAQNPDTVNPEDVQPGILAESDAKLVQSVPAMVPWQLPEGDESPHTGDETWITSPVPAEDSESYFGSGDELSSTHVDQSVLAVIATTIAAGHVSHRKSAQQRKAARKHRFSPPLNENPKS